MAVLARYHCDIGTDTCPHLVTRLVLIAPSLMSHHRLLSLRSGQERHYSSNSHLRVLPTFNEILE